MKKHLIITLIFLSTISYAQIETVLPEGNYYVKIIPSKTVDDQGKSTSTVTLLNDSNQKKEVVDEIKSSKYLKVDYIDENDIVHFKFENIDDKKAVINYTLALKDFKKIMSPYYDRFEWRIGVFAVPFKLRFNDFDFESDIALGANISNKIRFKREREDGFAVEPLVGFGLSKINLDESNSKIDTPGSTNAFTINTGVLIHLNSKINFGVFYGTDILSDKDNKKYDWIYNGNGWLGLGINVSFTDGKNNQGSL
jgi:hypothetical protein